MTWESDALRRRLQKAVGLVLDYPEQHGKSSALAMCVIAECLVEFVDMYHEVYGQVLEERAAELALREAVKEDAE